MMKKLILFDIDGTLIDSGDASRSSLNKVFRKRFSVTGVFDGIVMAGKTDIRIIKEGLSRRGLPAGDEEMAALVSEYVKHLKIEIENNARHTKPGVFELLNALKEMKVCLLGLLTGNIERGARIKLGVFGLNRFFAAGAFGDDHEDRKRLLPVAVERFERISGKSIRYADCTVIGDTPEDVACARLFGAESIAVSTGRYSREDLLAARADHVFSDLSQAIDVIPHLVASD
ncbi:MAG: HAD hydrolase-like protein [Deltaproteobacteria bacterium]|nr:HAD hydrolase-like protein [Deltaproteobacteria bacterium]